ncbi:replication-relaxation family protein [Saccharomonospora sp. CUA-673]|uniref:replication-relaxation family protein n=1 Tax=Saccharomonospora sp. CUA-673 TaxID=1904969 RepID=UPI000B10944A|nr:replication-relaxation family protein [Saccharomonospora sp. CUA-673]
MDKARGAGARLIGHNQSLFTHGVGRRSRSQRKAAGEPDGALWAQLTPRDRVVLELVGEHHVLTTEQLRALLFPSISRAQHRLLALTEAGVLWRTQPYRAEGGSKPFHYLLGYRGAELLAAQHGSAPPRPAKHADRLRRILESPRLAHLLGVNQFFAELGEYSRRTGLGTFLDDERGFDREGLHTWRCEQWITNFYERTITPDGYGCWHERGGWLGFFLEHDTGTEPIYKVADKIDRYTSSERSGDPWDVARRLAGMVLIWTSSTRRENLLRRSLRAKGSPVPVATASREHGHPDGPAGEVWSVVTTEPELARRVRLGALPAVIGGTTDNGTPTVLANLTRPTPAATAADSPPSSREGASADELILDDEPEPRSA